jgi:DNA-binding MarR family transcriptional regulator
MSSRRIRRTPIPPIAAALERESPYVGALLRMANTVSRERSLRVLAERGFTDLNQALLGGFFWPPPDGARPIDLAERANVTKQAMNYIIGELEKLGYMERRGERAGARRRVYLTRRGWQVFEAIWTAQKELQAEWAAALGRKPFAAFMVALRRLSGFDAKRKDVAGVVAARFASRGAKARRKRE